MEIFEVEETLVKLLLPLTIAVIAIATNTITITCKFMHLSQMY